MRLIDINDEEPYFDNDELTETLEIKKDSFFINNFHPICKPVTDIEINDIYFSNPPTFDELKILSCYIMTTYRDKIIKNSIDWYSDLKNIAGSPAYYTNLFPKIVVKMTDLEKETDESAHEALIGIKGTNKLRCSIPNFSYVLGTFKYPCFYREEIPRWINQSEQCTFTIYEFIPGDTWDTFIKTCSTSQFLNAFLQIILSIQLSILKIGFTHYDLHPKNLILREVNDILSIQYVDYLLYTDLIPTFIDYGSSHIKINEQDYGRGGIRNIGSVYNDRSFWLSDIAKLLFFTFYYIHPEIRKKLQRKNLLASESIYKENLFISNMNPSSLSTIQYFKDKYYMSGESFIENKISIARNNISKSHDTFIQMKNDYPRLLLEIEEDQKQRKNLFNTLEELVKYFIGFKDPINFIESYSDTHPYFQIVQTKNNESSDINEFIDFIIATFPETKTFLVNV